MHIHEQFAIYNILCLISLKLHQFIRAQYEKSLSAGQCLDQVVTLLKLPDCLSLIYVESEHLYAIVAINNVEVCKVV